MNSSLAALVTERHQELIAARIRSANITARRAPRGWAARLFGSARRPNRTVWVPLVR